MGAEGVTDGLSNTFAASEAVIFDTYFFYLSTFKKFSPFSFLSLDFSGRIDYIES
jgi:hypothetical protein